MNQWLKTRRSEGVHLGFSIFVAIRMKQNTSAYASQTVVDVLCQSTDIKRYSNHSKDWKIKKGSRYRVIRNSNVICHRQPRLPQAQVTATSLRELRLCPALRFVDYLAFFFSGATTLRFESPRETNFCETTRHPWKNP